MAPVKVPKKALKSTSTKYGAISRPIMKSKKSKKENYQKFTIYLFKLLQMVYAENLGNSSKNKLNMKNFMKDMLERIAVEVGKSKKSTLGSRNAQAAVKLVLSSDLATSSDRQVVKAMNRLRESQERDAAAKVPTYEDHGETLQDSVE